ncbi:MAG: hypothetical protein R6V58_01710 [Planctomycetota bacterium]
MRQASTAARRRGSTGGAWALAAFGLLLAAAPAFAKPRPPIVLRARAVATDRAAGTADVEITTRSIIQGAAVAVSFELPDGVAVVPGAGGWRDAPNGRGRVLRIRVNLAPGPAKLVIKARLLGEGLDIGTVTAVSLPGTKIERAAREKPRILKTTRGERLRLHKKNEKNE